MHQEPQNGNNYPQNNQVPQNQSANRYTYNNLVNIQHPSTTRSAVSSRSGNIYGNVSQVTTPATVAPVKTPFSVVKGITQSTTSSHNPSSTVQHFASPNKKITIPNIVKPPQTMQIQKIKLEVKEEVVEEDPLLLREKILQLYYDSVEEIKCNFKEKLQELFFVQSGGNMVDYPAWKQRPNPHLLSFLNIYRLDDTTTLSTPTATNTVSPSIKMQAAYTPAGSGTTSQHSTPHLGIPNVRFSSFPEINKILPQTAASSVGQYGFVQGVHSPQVDTVRKTSIQSVNVTPVKQEPVTINKDSSAVSKANDVSKIAFTTPTQPTPPPSTPNSSTSQDEILGQVRHESDIVQRISRLRKSGLWSASRLPKVYEQPRKKSQWDFLLEEMQWLATDFTQEKKWKRSMAKKISRSVMKFHQDKQAFQRKMKKEETARLKRVAGGIAKEVKSFWRQIEKVACYKQQSRQEEQRRKALDLHLNFIVGQTEKYSSWLAEGMKDSSISSAVSSRQVSDGDDNFEPDEKDAEDDEETIAEEENTSGDGKEKYQEELEALKEDSEMPIEELLKTLPSDMLARISGEGPSQSGDEGNMGEGESESDGDESSSESDVSVGGGEKDDEENVGDGGEEKKSDKAKSFDQSGVENNDNESGEEYVANEQEMQDDEQTIDEEEALGEVDHKEEIDALQNEAEMPIEELRKMYGMSTDSVPPPSDSESDTCDEVDSDLNSLTGDESDTNLMTNLTSELDVKKTSESTAAPETEEASVEKSLPNQQLTDAAATAESLQPKGFTLSTTQVKTKVPFLLHHTLREYQHIGLDWLVTMYQKQLNGILADEMGLGKTIQTIALLAHLACEEEIWGPHLIVVPTSVILNWEFEFKKWCPGFKILTYFGTQKERKMKRSGWMKPNAFHVCITSYNLVLQDHQAFRRRKWKYLILDEAQNIKNFKSQRWQMLLNFHSQRRLLLTGTPLQNHLMELWSLMHFLMPNIFTSHQDFKEWFANPLTGMIEGSTEYNEGIIKRLHTVLRPFLLRRLKSEVELQMPKKYEHVMKCRLSKRQRFLYDEFMSRTKTKETLEAGNFLSVINILMQLRKVCNHPDLFELRPTISPFVMDRLVYESPFLVNDVLPNEPPLGTCLSNYEQTMCAFQAHRTRQLKVPRHILKNLYNSNIDSSSVESNEPYLQNEISSSQFQPLSNVSGEVLSGHPGEAELTRSYFDCLTSSPSTAGYATIGDILTRQIEQSLECTNDIDVVNVDEESDELYCPVTKKQKMNESNSNNNSNNSNNSNNDKNKNEDKNNTSSCNLKLGHLLEDYMAEEVSPFHLNSLKEKTEEQRSSRLNYGALMNERHCDVSPVYGLDLHHAVKVCTCPSSRFVGALMHQYKRNNYSDVLSDVIKSPGRRLRERKSISDRYLLYIYPVLSSTIVLKSSHVVPSRELERKRLKCNLESLSFKKFDILSPMVAHIRLQFPETRLVQYDCGKLQTLDYLLHRLKFNKHRVLIFTQMTRMLDVLERFLNYHGFIYLRLDGSTKVDQRQMLMERFNHDQKIFVFILSTRSGGIGVNLTGADTVIFYDSDWNPTMDAQAQDRCHRIGQTRDVHIYRLISERTVEENILKKAQNKRLLGDIAIEGGNFTASYFKQQSIKELFDTNEESIEDKTTVVVSTKTTESASSATPAAKKEAIKGNQFEEVLAEVEEEDDVKASRRAKIEQDSELAEFNENAPVGDNADESKVEKALATLQNELKPIERFALKFMEETHSFHVEDEVEETEKMLEAKKKEWELDHLQSIKEAEEKKHAEEDDDMFFTYARDDTYSKVINNKFSPQKRRRRSRKKATVADNNSRKSDENDSPKDATSPNIHFRIQPLIMKLGDERIAQIKKVAQEAIEAKTIQNVSEFVKTRVRKQPTFFTSGSPTPKDKKDAENLSNSPRGKQGSHNLTPGPLKFNMGTPKGKPVPPYIKQELPRAKPGPKPGSKPGPKPGSKPGLKPGSKPGLKPGPKPGSKPGPKPGTPRVPKNAKTNQDPSRKGQLSQGTGKRGRPPLAKKVTTSLPMNNNSNNNQIFFKTQVTGLPQTLNNRKGFEPNLQVQQTVSKNRGTVTLKDFISHSRSNLGSGLGTNLKPQSANAVNLDQTSISHETLQKINNSVQNKFTNINVISNGINPYIQNNINHESFQNWNGVMPNSDLTIDPFMDGGNISLNKFNHNSMPPESASRVFPNYELNNMRTTVNKGNNSTLQNNFNYLSSNSDLTYVNTVKNETDTHILPARPIVLSQIPSAASSPMHSPASSDSGSDVRRSSRTPRPKFVDNNDWFLFS